MIKTYLDESTLPYPFCPGCGHHSVLNNLNAAFVKLQLDPKKIVLVTDIGCCGLSDKFFATNTFHGLHGRSVTYATGIKLANPELKVIVLIGDGGCGIGGHHLLNAARRNIGVTVFVMNNLNYGMTGGEHSVTTPKGAVTATTRYGQIEEPLDICKLAVAGEASYVARTTSFESTLTDMMAEAIMHEGFALVDIWELCTAHFAPRNTFSKKMLYDTLLTLGMDVGVIHKKEKDEFSKAYRTATASLREKPRTRGQELESKHSHHLTAVKSFLLAGAAGKKIVTAAATFGKGAILAGLWASQRNDYPVTVMSGYSLSEVIISPEQGHFVGGEIPDDLVALFPEGLAKVQGLLSEMTKANTLFIHSSLLPINTKAKVVSLDFTGRDKYWAMRAMLEVVRLTDIYPLEAFIEAVSCMREGMAEEYLAVIKP
jgi:pyruvate/2-oxoacid:ferredoxin oxidoreductase beta subunit